MRPLLLRSLLAALLVGLVLPGCADGADRVHTTATFTDVADLAEGAPVMMLDVTIGKVTGIDLDPSGRKATVRMSVERSAEVPADVVARVRRTTPLGEKFVDLAPQTTDAGAALLADGAVIDRTEVVSDLEQVMVSGTATFGALSVSQIAVLLEEGQQAFGEQGPELNTVLARMSDLADGYQTRTGEITAIVDDLGKLAADMAPATDENGRALAELAETTGILEQHDQEFFEMVRSLNRLAADGDRILTRHMDQIEHQMEGLRDVIDAIAVEDEALGRLLRNLWRHNETLPLAERSKFAQVLLDVVLCGIPGGGDVPGDPVDSCYPGEEP